MVSAGAKNVVWERARTKSRDDKYVYTRLCTASPRMAGCADVCEFVQSTCIICVVHHKSHAAEKFSKRIKLEAEYVYFGLRVELQWGQAKLI